MVEAKTVDKSEEIEKKVTKKKVAKAKPKVVIGGQQATLQQCNAQAQKAQAHANTQAEQDRVIIEKALAKMK